MSLTAPRPVHVHQFHRARLAQRVAEWLYRCHLGDDYANLRDLPAEKQMPYHSEVEAAIARLDQRSVRSS